MPNPIRRQGRDQEVSFGQSERPFDFPTNLKNMTWEQKEELHRQYMARNINDSRYANVNPSILITEDQETSEDRQSNMLIDRNRRGLDQAYSRVTTRRSTVQEDRPYIDGEPIDVFNVDIPTTSNVATYDASNIRFDPVRGWIVDGGEDYSVLVSRGMDADQAIRLAGNSNSSRTIKVKRSEDQRNIYEQATDAVFENI